MAGLLDFFTPQRTQALYGLGQILAGDNGADDTFAALAEGRLLAQKRAEEEQAMAAMGGVGVDPMASMPGMSGTPSIENLPIDAASMGSYIGEMLRGTPSGAGIDPLASMGGMGTGDTEKKKKGFSYSSVWGRSPKSRTAHP